MADKRMTKEEVVEKLVAGIYRKNPEQLAKDAFGYDLDPWQKRGIRKLFLSKKKKLSVVACHGAGKCAWEEDRITLANGEVHKLKNLIGQKIEIVSLNQENDMQQTREVAYVVNNGTQPTWKISLERGREITRTGNHPLLHQAVQFRHGNRPIWGESYWVGVSELKIGDLVCVPEKINVEGNKRAEEWKVKLLAYLIGDGCITAGYAGFSQKPGPRLDEYRGLVESLGLRLREDAPHNYAAAREGGVKKNPIIDFLRETGMMGLGSADKHFPDFVWTLPNDQLAIFLSRLFGCDGWASLCSTGKKRIGIRPELGYVSKSERLIRDVNLACLRFGISGILKKKKKYWTHKGIKKSDFYWTWTIGDCRSILKFLEQIGLFGKESASEKIKQYCQRIFFTNRQSQSGNKNIKWAQRAYKWPYHNLPDGLRWEKIASIEYMGELPTVAISVPTTNTYISDFVEHNSFVSGLIVNMFPILFTPSLSCITGPTGKQTRSQVWSYVSRVHDRGIFKDDFEWYRTKLALKGYEEETFSTWVSSKNPKTIEGFHGPQEGENLLWVVEEAKGVEDAVFESISGAISHDNCFEYISSTAGPPKGFFYRTHTTLKDQWETEHISYLDCPRVSREQVEVWAQQWGRDSAIFKARVMAEFPSESEYAIANLSWLERAVRKNGDDQEENDNEAA